MNDYWSSTTSGTEYAVVVNMEFGYSLGKKTWGNSYTWPVRSAP